MALQDRMEFKDWLARRGVEERPASREEPLEGCDQCGARDVEFYGRTCIVCLAEQFGIESAEERIALLVRGLILSATGDAQQFVEHFQRATWALQETV